jgi:predicted nucleotidyltransferase
MKFQNEIDCNLRSTKENRVRNSQKKFSRVCFFIFGARATQKNLKPFSDLDIAIQGAKKINPDALNQAQEDFSLSNLPFKVDLIDIDSISDKFRQSIISDFIRLE